MDMVVSTLDVRLKSHILFKMSLLPMWSCPWRIDPYTQSIKGWIRGWMRECKQKQAPIFVLVNYGLSPTKLI